MESFLFIGGDKRRRYAAQYIEAAGYNVTVAQDCAEFEKMVAAADYVVLPLPVSRDGINVNSPLNMAPVSLRRVLRAVDKDKKVFAGMPDKDFAEKLKCKGVKIYDYYQNEAMTILNSVSTAEGVIHEIIGSTEINIQGAKTALFGYGKSASAIARRMVALGAEVWVFARSERDRAAAETDGCKAVHLNRMTGCDVGFDVVVNTVPSLVVTGDFIEKLPETCLIVEIASAPYGVDFAAAESRGIRAVKAPSLPGRYAPKSAGEVIARTILNAVKGDEE